MKIDNCDSPFLPGKQKRRAEVICERVCLHERVCVREGVRWGQSCLRRGGGGGVREVSDKEDKRRG